ncbi:2'-5' RNA ligase family protein [Nocardia huaxiensis]|uniref:2'-5' RNA ligase family protein n=1 Tax=Nocardia huaxiensis TaxID=2755382 RepID=A0A7D6Z7N5_9NOCA|nr:2'-5' RNA ligase family protein [Nocardia huaxiensis]QLY33764.1 2'-5' RNA ligase family protein [Nocardia huaxiensis]UFS99310.1 2'-5' RNA ligase family protein [Nocardia huaxiensis]
MVQSVELILDETSEAEIHRQWQTLAAAGLHAPSPAHRPHITVAVAQEIWPRLDKTLGQQGFQPFPLRLGGLLVFGARSPILVRAVVPSAELLTLQHKIFEVIAACPGIPTNLRPDAWTPHVTLARRLREGQLQAALDAVGSDRDYRATVVGIRRWDGDRRLEWPVA